MMPFAGVAPVPSAPPPSTTLCAGVGIPLRRQPAPPDKLVAAPLLTPFCRRLSVADGAVPMPVCAAASGRAQMALVISKVSQAVPKLSFALTGPSSRQPPFYNKAKLIQPVPTAAVGVKTLAAYANLPFFRQTFGRSQKSAGLAKYHFRGLAGMGSRIASKVTINFGYGAIAC